MTRKPKGGTLSTTRASDKKEKEKDVLGKMKALLHGRKMRIHPHANERMAERGVIYYEVLQVLVKGRHEPKRDRYSVEHDSWEYSITGKTIDDRELRIGIAFELDPSSNERLLVVTVIDPRK